MTRGGRELRLLVAAIFVLPFLAGCLGGTPESGGPAGADESNYPRGVHPYPHGDEWPAGADGPFKLKELQYVKIPSFDRVELEAWIYLPDLPGGAPAPAILWSLPYLGQTYQTGDNPSIRDNSGAAESVPINLLIEHGYAVAAVSVRGTGNSAGCFEMFGRNEQKDQAFLVEWLAKQPWSNGRVGMMGLSYHGTTPWEAAIQNPPSLKTIVVAGMVSDLYTFYHSAQGADLTIGPAFQDAFVGLVSAAPPVLGSAQHAAVNHAPVVPSRACPEVAKVLTELWKGHATDSRDSAFWKDRRLIDDFPNITTSILLTHGFQDLHGSGHQTQEDWVWNTLAKAPMRMLEGQWGHEFPNFNSFRPAWAMKDWNDRLLLWLDYWLKGIGDAPPRVGVVDYQDGLGAWHESAAWPPVERKEEVLYLSATGLRPLPQNVGKSFRSVPMAQGPEVAFCYSSSVDGSSPFVRYMTEPASEPILIAGNPFAHLLLRSDLPGGQVALHLFDVTPNYRCDGPVLGAGVRLWTAGVADLRFHAGNLAGRAFPTGSATAVRVDMPSIAEVLEPGHRLAVVASYGFPEDRSGQPYFPTLALDGGSDPRASHLVLPIVEGTFGGAAPILEYTPRPFVPLLP